MVTFSLSWDKSIPESKQQSWQPRVLHTHLQLCLPLSTQSPVSHCPPALLCSALLCLYNSTRLPVDSNWGFRTRSFLPSHFQMEKRFSPYFNTKSHYIAQGSQSLHHCFSLSTAGTTGLFYHTQRTMSSHLARPACSRAMGLPVWGQVFWNEPKDREKKVEEVNMDPSACVMLMQKQGLVTHRIS